MANGVPSRVRRHRTKDGTCNETRNQKAPEGVRCFDAFKPEVVGAEGLEPPTYAL